MPGTCCVPGCTSNNSRVKGNYINSFKFPKCEERKTIWCKAIGRPDFAPSRCAVVCIKHFEHRFIVRYDACTRSDGTVLVAKRTRMKLTSNAVPTIIPKPPEPKRSPFQFSTSWKSGARKVGEDPLALTVVKNEMPSNSRVSEMNSSPSTSTSNENGEDTYQQVKVKRRLTLSTKRRKRVLPAGLIRWKNEKMKSGLGNGKKRRKKDPISRVHPISDEDSDSLDESVECDEESCTIDLLNGPKVFAEPPVNLMSPENNESEQKIVIKPEPLQESACSTERSFSSTPSILKRLLTDENIQSAELTTKEPAITDQPSGSMTIKQEAIDDRVQAIVKQEVIENNRISVETQTEYNEDEAFFNTLLPVIGSLSPPEKIALRAQILELIARK